MSATSEPPVVTILVTAPLIARFESDLRSRDAGYRWIIAAGWTEEQVLAIMPEVDVLVCTGMTVDQAQAGRRLKLVHVAGAGFDRIPLEALSPSVCVANTYHHSRAIAEHVIMVCLMLTRRVIEADRELRAGVWRNTITDNAVPLHRVLEGQVLGVLGFGGIGAEVARLARAMGMGVQVVRRNPGGAVPGDVTVDWVGGMDELPQLLSRVDFLVVAIPLTEETRGVIDAAAIATMKPTAFLINVARGAVVDEAALYDALLRRRIAGAALDVWWANPPGPGNPPASELPFGQLDNVVLTPHSSGLADVTFQNRAKDIALNIDNLAHGRALFNVVRQPS